MAKSENNITNNKPLPPEPTDAEHEAEVQAWEVEARSRIVGENEIISPADMFLVLRTEIEQALALMRRRPAASPEPASGALVEAAKELAEIVRSQCGGHVPGSGPGGKALVAAQKLIEALAAEKAREPGEPSITLASHNEQMKAGNHALLVLHERDADIQAMRDEADAVAKKALEMFRAKDAEIERLTRERDELSGWCLEWRCKLAAMTKERDEALAKAKDVKALEAELATQAQARMTAEDERDDLRAKLAHAEAESQLPPDLDGLSEQDVLDGEQQIRDGDYVTLDELKAECQGERDDDAPLREFLRRYDTPYTERSTLDGVIAELCRRALRQGSDRG